MEDTYVCKNCNKAGPGLNADELTIRHKNVLKIYICPTCLKGTSMIKVVLRRDSDGNFQYEQYTAVAMADGPWSK